MTAIEPPDRPPRPRLIRWTLGAITVRGAEDGDPAKHQGLILDGRDIRSVRRTPADEASLAHLPSLGDLLRNGPASRMPDSEDATSRASILSPRRLGVIIQNCIVDPDIRVALDDSVLTILNSAIRGFGEIRWMELAVRNDGKTVSAFIADFDDTIAISARTLVRPTKHEDEDAAGQQVADAINAARGTNYAVRRWVTRPEYPDAELVCSGRPKIKLEVRQFEDLVARKMRGPDRAVSALRLADPGLVLQGAIDRKACVDPSFRGGVHLALLSPVSLGAVLRAKVASLDLDARGFADVWCCPFREKAFSLVH
jgi:hypothetical protein